MEQSKEREKERAKEEFLITSTAKGEDEKASQSKNKKGEPSSRDLWSSTSHTKSMLQSVPKDLDKRLHKVDSRFLTAKEKLSSFYEGAQGRWQEALY